MKPDDGSESPGTSVIGTPLDYTEHLYQFYLEVPHFDGTAERLIREFLGERHAARLRRLTHGFELVMPIQCAPDLVRRLAGANIAVYQLVRVARADGEWRDASGSSG
jgi:hypothetical protein